MYNGLYRRLVTSRDRFPAHNEIRSSGKHWGRKVRVKSKTALYSFPPIAQPVKTPHSKSSIVSV